MKRPGQRFSRLGKVASEPEDQEEAMQDPLTLLVQVQAAQKAVREQIWLEIAVREAPRLDCSQTGLSLWRRLRVRLHRRPAAQQAASFRGGSRVDVCLA